MRRRARVRCVDAAFASSCLRPQRMVRARKGIWGGEANRRGKKYGGMGDRVGERRFTSRTSGRTQHGSLPCRIDTTRSPSTGRRVPADLGTFRAVYMRSAWRWTETRYAFRTGFEFEFRTDYCAKAQSPGFATKESIAQSTVAHMSQKVFDVFDVKHRRPSNTDKDERRRLKKLHL